LKITKVETALVFGELGATSPTLQTMLNIATFSWSGGGGPAAQHHSIRPRLSPPVLQINSDSRVTAEYFDYLLGRNQLEEKEDCPSIIVGGGRIGGLLRELGERRSYDDVIIKRGDPIPADHPGPIYVCTRNDDLAAVVAACPEEKLADLVFLQNGNLEPFRQRYGLYDQTQAMLWLALLRQGGKPVDGISSMAPDGLTTATGKWAEALKMRLGTADLTCNVVKDRDYRRNMLEKLVWISSFMLIGQVHGGITVGEVAKKHFPEVEEMVIELAGMIRTTVSVSFKPEMPERLCAYSEQVEFFPTAVKELKWRNGWFYRYSLLEGKRTLPDGRKIEMPDPTPMHTDYLLHLQDKGELDLSEIKAEGMKW